MMTGWYDVRPQRSWPVNPGHNLFLRKRPALQLFQLFKLGNTPTISLLSDYTNCANKLARTRIKLTSIMTSTPADSKTLI